MTHPKIILSHVLWAGFAIMLGCSIGYKAHQNLIFCNQLPNFCELITKGHGMWFLSSCAVLLLYGCVDLLKLVFGVLHRQVEITSANRLRLKLAIWQTIFGGLGLLLLLLAAFTNTVNK